MSGRWGGRTSDRASARDAADVSSYISALEHAGTDQLKFSNALSAVKGLGKSDVDQVAAGYAKGRSKWSTKGEALKAIEYRFRERAYQAVKMNQVAKASTFG